MSFVSKWLPVVARVLFGLVFVVFGANGFLNFMPPPPPPPPAAAAFAGGLFSAGYFLLLLKGTEIVAGLLLLANRYVALALILLAPIVLNIAGFHIFLAPGGAGLAVVLLAIHVYLAWVYRTSYAPLLRAKAVVGGDEPARAEPALAS